MTRPPDHAAGAAGTTGTTGATGATGATGVAGTGEAEGADAAALAWFVRLHSGEATAAERAAFARWHGAAAAHRRAYARLESMWSELDLIADPRRSPRPAAPAGPARLPRRNLLAGGAAALAAGIGAVAVLPGLPSGDLSTGTGELRRAVLADGSRVELDARTALSVEFGPAVRRLVLHRGRAFFGVAPDPARPFSVGAAGGWIEALGTRFAVHRTGPDVAVAVEESAVRVIAPGQAAAAEVAAGWGLRYGPGELGAPTPLSAAGAEMAWRRGKLIFEDQPLGQVVADLNRYRPGLLRITDPALTTLRVSGIFDTADPEAALRAILRTLPVRATRLTRYLVLLGPA